MSLGTSDLAKLCVVLLAGVLLLASPLGCSDDDPVEPAGGGGDPGDETIHTDDGYIGMVIDTRSIFKKGYAPTIARIEFPDHDTHSADLAIDQVTNLAILSLHNEDLTAEERAAFGAGVAATLTILDEAKAVLATVDYSQLVLDDRNVPWTISTDLEHISKPVALRSDLPYLIQWTGSDNVVEQSGHDNVDPDCAYDPENALQQFYFHPVSGLTDVYTVWVDRYGELQEWIVLPEDTTRRIYCNTDLLPNPLQVTLEQDEDGYVKIKDHDSGLYVDIHASEGWGEYLYFPDTGFEKFRLISDHVTWSVIDRGTIYNQPIMPPARLDFAYSGTLRNCAPTTLEETIGRAESRTTTTSFSTTEAFQMFSSQTSTMGLTVGIEVQANLGIDVEGVGELGEEVSVSEEIEMSESYTYSQTSSHEVTWNDSVETTTEVSRVRTITVPAYTAVDVYDAVKTIDNVTVPFTQQIRISGVDKDTQEPLTGEEIQSQMLFNFVGGLITAVGDTYVDFTLRGIAHIDHAFEATTNVENIDGACD